MITTATDHVTAALDGVLVTALLVLVGHAAVVVALATGLIVSAGMLLTFAAHRRHLRSLQPCALVRFAGLDVIGGRSGHGLSAAS